MNLLYEDEITICHKALRKKKWKVENIPVMAEH